MSTIETLAQIAKQEEWGSEEQVDAFNALCCLAEQAGFDEDDIDPTGKATNDEIVDTIVTFLTEPNPCSEIELS